MLPFHWLSVQSVDFILSKTFWFCYNTVYLILFFSPLLCWGCGEANTYINTFYCFSTIFYKRNFKIWGLFFHFGLMFWYGKFSTLFHFPMYKKTIYWKDYFHHKWVALCMQMNTRVLCPSLVYVLVFLKSGIIAASSLNYFFFNCSALFGLVWVIVAFCEL